MSKLKQFILMIILILFFTQTAQAVWQDVDFYPDGKINILDAVFRPLEIKNILFYYLCQSGVISCNQLSSPSPSPSTLPYCKIAGAQCSSSRDCCTNLYCNPQSNVCQQITEADKYFTVSVADENFCLYSNNDLTIKNAWDNYQNLNSNHPQGSVLSGNGGYNYGFGGVPGDKYWRWWSWRLDPDTTVMAEASIEICDGLPSAVEYGPIDIGNYCPWLGHITSIGCRNSPP